jgi:hypothetical protein
VIVTAPVAPDTEIPVPATFDVTPVLAIVTAPEPLYEVPLNPVLIVNVAKLLPKAIPEIVLLDKAAFGIDVKLAPLPANEVAVTEPVTLMLPVNTCVLATNDPKRVDPVIKLTDEVIVCTTNVCAVNVPATVNAFANDDVTAEVANDELTAFKTYDAVVAIP